MRRGAGSLSGCVPIPLLILAKVLPPSRRLLATGQGWAGWPWVRECQAGRQALLGSKTLHSLSWVSVSSRGTRKVTSLSTPGRLPGQDYIYDPFMNILSLRSTNVIAQNDWGLTSALGRLSVLTDGCWVMRVHAAPVALGCRAPRGGTKDREPQPDAPPKRRCRCPA